MAKMVKRGRHFLHVPGPTNVPDRVARAMDNPIIDHRGPDSVELCRTVCAGMKRIFRTTGPIAIFPCSGTGAWEVALLNTLSPGDRILAFETGISRISGASWPSVTASWSSLCRAIGGIRSTLPRSSAA